MRWLIPRLERFREHHPELAISIDANAAEVDLESGTFDGAVRFSANPQDGLECVELIRPEIVVVAAPAFVPSTVFLQRVSDAKSHNLIHCKPPSRRQALLHVDWDDLMSVDESNKVSRNLIVSEDHMVLAATALGHGLLWQSASRWRANSKAARW